MGFVDLQWIGSFQNGIREWSESPLEGVWERVSLYSYPDHLRTVFTAPTLSAEEKAAVEDYATTRIRQAIEFRIASRSGTLLTAPLPLYYSALNLTRAFLALSTDTHPRERAHGLKFTKGLSVLDSTATVVRGTFHEAWGATLVEGAVVSLEECLSGIIELESEYLAVTGQMPLAVPIYVKGMRSGIVTLTFDSKTLGGEEHFRARWQEEFPSLTGKCSLEAEGSVLKVTADVDTGTYESISQFCAQHLEVALVATSSPTWHLIRQKGGRQTLPRPAYYFGAMFILGNIVRYEPEQLMSLVAQHSSVAWLLDRLLKTAERFYPNLMLNWVTKTPWFFGTGLA